MSTASEIEIRPMTAEDFGNRPCPGYPEELVEGRIEAMPPPGARHGQLCGLLARLLGAYLDAHRLGHLVTNDTGIVTQRGPDTVRGADIAIYSFEKVPAGPLPSGYLDVAPDLVIEILSPSDRWPGVLRKVAEYLEIGVPWILVIDPQSRSAQVYKLDSPGKNLTEQDDLPLPKLFGDGLQVPLSRLFD